MKFKLLGGCVVSAAFVALSAHATTKVFDYSDAGSTIATGSFSYASGDTGVLGYGDLTAFSVTVAGGTFDLAEVDTLTDYVYFGYDTAGNDFVTASDSCGYLGCGFQPSLSAINSSGTYGFYFSPAPGVYGNYSVGTGGFFDTIAISNGGVPEPATWALMLMGFGGLGTAVRSRRKRTLATT
jgi:hypothetical protein